MYKRQAEEDLEEPIFLSVKKRLPWLFILLGMGLGVSATVGLFESIVAQLPVIMCFQSLILDMAGNVGTQSLAVAIDVYKRQRITGDGERKQPQMKKLMPPAGSPVRMNLSDGWQRATKPSWAREASMCPADRNSACALPELF